MVEEHRGRRKLRAYPQSVHMLAPVPGGPEMVELSEYLEGKVGQQVHFPRRAEARNTPQKTANLATASNHCQCERRS